MNNHKLMKSRLQGQLLQSITSQFLNKQKEIVKTQLRGQTGYWLCDKMGKDIWLWSRERVVDRVGDGIVSQLRESLK